MNVFEAYIRDGKGKQPTPPDSLSNKIETCLGAVAPLYASAGSLLGGGNTVELHAMPAATPNFLGDPAIDIEQWISDEVEIPYAEQFNAKAVAALIEAKPRTIAIKSLNEDALIDAVGQLNPADKYYARWAMNRRTLSHFKKLMDADGRYSWSPAPDRTRLATLLGFEVMEIDDMPDIGTDGFQVLFGDFRKALGKKNEGSEILRDPFSATPYVLFYATKKIKIEVRNLDAILALKVGAQS